MNKFYLVVWSFLSVIYSSMLFSAPPPQYDAGDNYLCDYYISTGTVITPHFEIYWEKDSNSEHYSTDEWIDKVKDYLEKAWNYQINTNGYDMPPGTPTKKIRVDIWNLKNEKDDSYYGSCSWAFPPVMELENDYNSTDFPTHSGDEGLKITIAHEFFHCIQQKYYLSETIFKTQHVWLREGTAVFMEDQDYSGVVVDNINSYHEYDQDFLDCPEKSLDTRNSGNDPCSTVLFWIYLDQKYSGKIKNVLVNFNNNGNISVLDAIGQALGDTSGFGDNFKKLFKNFSLVCYMKDDATYGFADDGTSHLPDVAQITPTDDTK